MRLDGETGIVVLGTGEPGGPDDVEPFLAELFSDASRFLPWPRRLLRARWVERQVRAHAERMRHVVESIGVDLPARRIAAGQADGAAAAIGCEGYVAMRAGAPRAAETVELMLEEGMKRAIVIDGIPQRSVSVAASNVAAFRRAWTRAGRPDSDLLAIESWHEHPAYVGAASLPLRETIPMLRGGPSHVLFIAPTLPLRLARAEAGFRDRIAATRAAVIARTGLELPHDLAWLRCLDHEPGVGPHPDEEVARLGEEGVHNLVVAPLGFTADRLETLYHLDLELPRQARPFRMRIFRVPCLNDRPEMIVALASVIRDRARGAVA